MLAGDLIAKALAIECETHEIEFKKKFDTSSTQDWCEIVKDIVAIANSGGGVIVFGMDDKGNPLGENIENVLRLDPAKIVDKLNKYTDTSFAGFQIVEREKVGQIVAVLCISRSNIPLVFTKPGNYPVSGGRQKTAFSQGTIYFRHGAKSEPGTQDDIRKAVEREVEAQRDSWLSNIRKVVDAPIGSGVVLVPPEEEADDVFQMPIRVVSDDADAPKYRKVDFDETHPYRLKEVIERVNDKISGIEVNQYDIVSINSVHDTKQKEDFCHDPKYSTPQYSPLFVDWIVEQYEEDDRFFEKARKDYYDMRYGINTDES